MFNSLSIALKQYYGRELFSIAISHTQIQKKKRHLHHEVYKVSQNFTEGNTSKVSASSSFCMFVTSYKFETTRLACVIRGPLTEHPRRNLLILLPLIMLFHYFFTLYLSLVYTVNYFYLFPVLQNMQHKM